MRSPTLDQRRTHSASLAPISKIAAQLLEALGSRLASFVCDLTDPKALGRYVQGTQRPRPQTDRQLRTVHQIVTILEKVLPPEGVQAWFTALNPSLDDQSPVDLLRSDDPPAIVAVLNAARIFADDYPKPDPINSTGKSTVIEPTPDAPPSGIAEGA